MANVWGLNKIWGKYVFREIRWKSSRRRKLNDMTRLLIIDCQNSWLKVHKTEYITGSRFFFKKSVYTHRKCLEGCVPNANSNCLRGVDLWLLFSFYFSIFQFLQWKYLSFVITEGKSPHCILEIETVIFWPYTQMAPGLTQPWEIRKP